MKHDKFEKIMNRRIKLTKSVLSAKNKEYASDSDKLHNLKRAGEMLHCIPEKALIGMWTKHIISLLDIVDNIEKHPSINPELYTPKKVLEEKIGDAINYLILLEALIKERYEKKKPLCSQQFCIEKNRMDERSIKRNGSYIN